MHAIGAYGIVRAQEAGRKQPDARSADDRSEGGREHGLGLRARVRKLFGGKRVAREPGFAASSSYLSDFVPLVRAYPYPPTYR
jgi:hypothetical protein